MGVVEGRDANGRVRVRLYLPDGAVTEDGMGEEGARAGTKRSRSGRATTTTNANANANAKKDGDSERFRAMRNALTATASKGEWCWELKNLANISTVTREWLAIHAFPSLPYASVVLSGTPASAGAAAGRRRRASAAARRRRAWCARRRRGSPLTRDEEGVGERVRERVAK